MTFDSALQSLAAMFPASLSESESLLGAAGVAVVAALASVYLLARVAGLLGTGAGGRVRTAPAPAAPALAGHSEPDLNPDEWLPGNVIHFDRQRAFGLIRCDRLKAPVRFESPALTRCHEPGLRIGAAVRFKGRHGARRRPVADIVEPVRARRAG